MAMRLIAGLLTCTLAFVATLAVIIGLRLPEETRLIALGVGLGVAVCVPTSAVVSAAAARAIFNRRYANIQAAMAAQAAQPAPEPQIFFVPTPPAPAPEPQPRPSRPRAAPLSDAGNAYTNDVPGARRFTIIGGTGQDDV